MRHLVLLLAVSLFSLVASAETYLCNMDQSTGFTYENGSWESTLYKPGKLLIKSADSHRIIMDVAVYQVHWFGREDPSYVCKNGFGSEYIGVPDMLDCEGYPTRGNTFTFNKSTGNFLAISADGYLYTIDDGTVSHADTAISIGKCSKLD